VTFVFFVAFVVQAVPSASGSVRFANRPNRFNASSMSDRSMFACAIARCSVSIVRS